MELSISCDAFVRLSRVANSNSPDEKREYLTSVWLEVSPKGDVIAVATNHKVAAIEYLGRSTEQPFGMNVTVDEPLIRQCETEIAFNSNITFVNIPELKMISAKTSLGFNYQGNAGVYTEMKNHFETWREWLPDELPTEVNGGVFCRLDHLAVLASSSPTGSVIFQEIIDNKKPVIVQDVHNENWIGVFMPNPDAATRSPEPFKIPAWLK